MMSEFLMGNVFWELFLGNSAKLASECDVRLQENRIWNAAICAKLTDCNFLAKEAKTNMLFISV
jgi:hypothetical protein